MWLKLRARAKLASSRIGHPDNDSARRAGRAIAASSGQRLRSLDRQFAAATLEKFRRRERMQDVFGNLVA